jgi:hypothetical protein
VPPQAALGKKKRAGGFTAIFNNFKSFFGGNLI